MQQAVILAGGKGTRMGDITMEIPKPMLPLAGQPLLAYQIEWLKKNGFKEVWLIINHLGHVIEEYFGNGEQWGIQIRYYREEKPLGTVGGIKAIEQELKEDFLVLYGDVLFDIDFERLLTFHRSKASQATLVIHPNDHPYDSDLVATDESGKVIAFHPKPHPEEAYYRNMVNAAMYVLSPAIFPYLQKDVPADFGKDIFPHIINHLSVYGYNTPEYIKDMGTPKRLDQVTTDLLSGKIGRRNLSQPQKAIFLDRDGVINPDKGLICSPEDFELYPFVAEAIRKINKTDYLAIIITNQPGIAKGLYDFDTLNAIHSKMDTLLGEKGAKIDALYFCPHHPEKGFPGERPEYKVACDCRKPESGMLIRAAETFNIDLSASFMIGDHGRDIIAGHRVGCTTIGVRTGHALDQAEQHPDHIANNLAEAVDLILNL